MRVLSVSEAQAALNDAMGEWCYALQHGAADDRLWEARRDMDNCRAELAAAEAAEADTVIEFDDDDDNLILAPIDVDDDSISLDDVELSDHCAECARSYGPNYSGPCTH